LIGNEKTIVLFENCILRGHCMCKEMPGIPVDREDKKRIMGKMEGQGGGKNKGLLTPPPQRANSHPN
jgi:hypothetical protein